MENGNGNFLVYFTLGICFILLNPANADNKTEPRVNPNLSPFESWRSAYFCLQNTSSSGTCWSHTLSLDGSLTVKDTEINDYCSRGCYQHTVDVMKCVQDVKRDFTFGNKAPIWFVRNAIDNACNDKKGFNITYHDPNSATSLYGRFYVPLISALMTLAFISTFSV